MSKPMKTIGVLTSGGDAPGMNAAVRAVVRSGIQMGMNVLGIMRGYNGLISGDMVEMELRSVSDIIHRGGTILYTARCARFREQAGLEEAKQTCIEKGLDGIVVIGGDGSFRGARDLSLLGVPCVGLPGTIDNDIAASDYTIGYDTAMNTAMQMVDRLRDTTQSHDRCSVVEVMGRRAGYIALNTGIACGATAILVPEVPFDFKRDIYDRMLKTQKTGKQHFIIVVAEGVFLDGDLTLEGMIKKIQTETQIETRGTVLGHVQRGGSPTVEDRVNASLMGNYAVELLSRGVGNRVVVMKDSKIVDFDIYEALQMTKSIDRHVLEVAHQISI